MTEQVTVQEALAAVMNDVGAVRKGDRNTHQNFQFRGIDTTVNAVSPALQKHGVVVTPELQSLNRSSMQTSRGNAMNSIDVIVKYTFTGPAGDSISATVPGEAFDSGDKATPKAMSVAFRIALLQSLALPTDEPDPDHESHQAAPGPQQAQAQQGFDFNGNLQRVWNSVDQLGEYRKWIAKNMDIKQLPENYLETIRKRENELRTTTAQSPQQ